jgi:hypothetical protein
MTLIHFVLPSGINPRVLSGVVSNYNCWNDGTSGHHYGVAFPQYHTHPQDVVDALTALGAVVLPGMHDTTAIPAAAAATLAVHGVAATDTTFACATKMYAASGVNHFRPHRY